jgi:hypothetical protein
MALYTLYRDSKAWDGIYKVQVSATHDHVVAVTKAGQLFTWGCGFQGCLGHNNRCNELWPKRVKHGGFAELFIVCAIAGCFRSTAIDSSGLVPILLFFSTILDIATLQFIINPCWRCYHSYGPFDMMQLIVRDLEKIGFWSQVVSIREAGFFLDLWGFFWKSCGCFFWAGVHMGA